MRTLHSPLSIVSDISCIWLSCRSLLKPNLVAERKIFNFGQTHLPRTQLFIFVVLKIFFPFWSSKKFNSMTKKVIVYDNINAEITKSHIITEMAQSQICRIIKYALSLAANIKKWCLNSFNFLTKTWNSLFECHSPIKNEFLHGYF